MTAPVKRDPLLKPDAATDHILGPASAEVTVIEYGDFECPSCGQAHSAVKIMLDHFGPQLRFVFRHYPQREIHPHAELAAEAAEAAGAQRMFWPFHDLLFAHQQQLQDKQLLDYAGDIGLDLPRYKAEMLDHVYLQRVQEHLAGAQHLGIRATPTFYVNGAVTDASLGPQHLHQAIERALNAGR
ncbi:MAG: DsbA family protein [Rhodoferax sp.]